MSETTETRPKVDGRTLRRDIIARFEDECATGELSFTAGIVWSEDRFPTPILRVFVTHASDYATYEALVDYILNEWMPQEKMTGHLQAVRRRYVVSRGHRWSYDERHLINEVNIVLGTFAL